MINKQSALNQLAKVGYFKDHQGALRAFDANGSVIDYAPEALVDLEGTVTAVSGDRGALLRKLASGDWVWANVKGKYAQYKYDTAKEWHLAECIHCGESPVIIGCICVDCEAQMYAIDQGEEIWHDEEPEIGCKICYSVDK
ncbi:MAG: hypothetical protein GY776_15815, partial [Alteromonas sp.]|nr:hypothetical protein [Alteromonas sp.]